MEPTWVQKCLHQPVCEAYTYSVTVLERVEQCKAFVDQWKQQQ